MSSQARLSQEEFNLLELRTGKPGCASASLLLKCGYLSGAGATVEPFVSDNLDLQELSAGKNPNSSFSSRQLHPWKEPTGLPVAVYITRDSNGCSLMAVNHLIPDYSLVKTVLLLAINKNKVTVAKSRTPLCARTLVRFFPLCMEVWSLSYILPLLKCPGISIRDFIVGEEPK